jgi:hypothetical protein
MNESLIEKVKKLLALAASPNENEAKLAMSKAKDLIAKYCLDLSQENKTEDIIESVYTFSKTTPSMEHLLPMICLAVTKQFGVYVLIQGRVHPTIKFVGYRTNIEVAKHAADCILNWGFSDYRRLYKLYRTISFGQGFWEGFARGVAERFKDPPEKQELALVVYDAVKRYMEKFETANLNLTGQLLGQNEGRKSGTDAQLHPGMNTGNTGNLLR